MKSTALIVDDEADIRELVEITLSRMGLATAAAATLEQAQTLLAEQHFDVCLTDMRLPDGNGIDLVKHITTNYPNCPVAVITAYGNAEAAVASLKSGAFDFVSKPVDINSLRDLIQQALRLSPEKAEAETPPDTPRLLGQTPAMQKLRTTIGKLARSQAPVYITGESGTGKELVARTIHAQGPRSNMPFIPVNCGAIPSELMESEFFGHIKGAFTGAIRDKKGLFACADGGTLFLDEVADLPLALQVKLLRAIQERTVRPVGAEQETRVDIRVISATHNDLTQLVADGQFREDLYYRLNVIEIHVPALRERPADIADLSKRILYDLARQLSLPRTPTLTSEAQACLANYEFPGNVRELENILERGATLCDQAEIGVEYLRLNSPASNSHTAHETTSADNTSLESRLEDIERQSLIDALEAARHNKTKAAKQLGITFRALRYRLKKHGIE